MVRSVFSALAITYERCTEVGDCQITRPTPIPKMTNHPPPAQDDVLLKAFGGTYGSEKEASIEEYVDKMREYKKNILNTKTQ